MIGERVNRAVRGRMSEFETRLRATLAHGALPGRDGSTGCWFVQVVEEDDAGVAGAWVVCLSVARNGAVTARMKPLRRDGDAATVAHAAMAREFRVDGACRGRALLLVENVVGGTAPFLVDARLSRHVRRAAEAAGLREAPATPHWAVAVHEAMRECLAAVHALLDPFAIDQLERCATDEEQTAVGAAWDAVSSDTPMRRMLRDRPGLRRSVLRAHVANGAAFADDDGARRAVEDVLRSDGVPPRLVPLVWNAETALSAMDEEEEAFSLSGFHDWDDAWTEPDQATWLVRDLAPLPASWRPKTIPEWQALASVSWAVIVCRGATVTPRDQARLLGAKGRWSEYLARLRKAGEQDCVTSSMQDACDVAFAYEAEVLGPALAAHPPAEAWKTDDVSWRGFAMLYSGASMPRILRGSVAWHRADPRRRAAMASLPGERVATGWPAGLPDHAEGDLVLRVLTNPEALDAEGVEGPDDEGLDGLSHCAGGYAPDCRCGHCRVASVQRIGPGGRESRVSTVEFTRRGGTPGTVVVVEQHRGNRNGKPPRDAEAFVQRYLAALLDGSLAWAPDDWEPVPGFGGPLDAAGYDASVPGNWEAVRDLWNPHVPRALRGLDAATLAATARAMPCPRFASFWTDRPVVPVPPSER